MNRRDLIGTVALLGAGSAMQGAGARAEAPRPVLKQPLAITMWDFSWLERRWPGAGFEDWDQALDELVERGYNAVRIDPYPHLLAAAPQRTWLLKPVWDTQDWGAPTWVQVRILPELVQFIQKCRERHVRVGLSTWYRQDQHDVRQTIRTPARMAEIWSHTLAAIEQAGLLDQILYVDLCNEWPGMQWSPLHLPSTADWSAPSALEWMRTAIGELQQKFPTMPLLFSTNNDRIEKFSENDVAFVGAIEHHVWMTGENDDEFYQRVGYKYQRFSQAGYHNLQLRGAKTYAEKPAYWQGLLTAKIARMAEVSRHIRRPLLTTECWAIVDYKDWPMLPWDWVKTVCALGASTASATGQWAAIGTSNFCAPQFRGMWRDVAWHQALTTQIKSGPLDASIRAGLLWGRL